MIRLFVASLTALAASAALAHGAGDDRVALPDGAGSLGGAGVNAAVNNAQGGLALSFPIDVPSGFDGLTPAVAFSYDSNGGGASELGIGWSLSAGSSIERMTQRGLPDYDADDVFVKDGGSELVRVAAAGVVDGEADVAEYRARFEGAFERVRFHDVGDGSAGYFTVEHGDGTVGFYGADKDGVAVEAARERGPKGVFRWHLVDVVDVFGQRMHHTYAVFGGKPLLARIDYVFAQSGGVDDDAGLYAVAFDYEDRPDPVSTARGGYNDLLTQRLAAVRVLSSERDVRRVAVTYEDEDDAFGRSRVARFDTFGKDGGRLETSPTFVYARALSGTGACDGADCGKALLVDLGDIGVDLSSRTATLIDMNSDALPDLVVGNGTTHQIRLSVRNADGTQSFGAPRASALGADTTSFDISSPYVQPLDVDGDGDVDLVSAADASVLLNNGQGDWSARAPLAGTADLPDFGEDFGLDDPDQLGHTRFLDIDLDRRIDVVRSDGATTDVFKNDGDNGFVSVAERGGDVTVLGVGFLEDGADLADVNGDGLLDVVVLGAGSLRVRENLGGGRFAAFAQIDDVPVSVDELPFASLEDVDNDGCDDLVVVIDGEVKIARNRAGLRFDDVSVIDNVDGVAVPDRDDDTVVLFADMNGNGSNDVVWFFPTGAVTALDVTPVPAHLLSRIETENGSVTEVEWSTAVAHRANDAGVGWDHPLPQAVVVVDTVTGYASVDANVDEVKEVTTRRYTDGFYDGDELSFRGFRQTVIEDLPAAGQEGGVLTELHDVGDDGRPWFAGLTLRETHTTKDGVALAIVDAAYDDCDITVAGVADPRALGIHYVCPTSTTTTTQERRPQSEWVVTRERYRYDGYGRRDGWFADGVVAVDGDEAVEETTWVDPTDNVAGRWILDLPVVVVEHDGNGGRTQVKRSFYDGAAYEGLAAGVVAEGLLSRESVEVDDDDRAIDVTRRRYDDAGNLVEELSPLADALDDDGGDRRFFTWDALGLRVIEETEVVSRGAGTENGPRRLVRSTTYDPTFGLVDSTSTWRNDDDAAAGVVRTAYDEFGREAAIVEPGDSLAAPSIEKRYENAAPYSRVVTRVRSTSGEAPDIERIACVDGRGRLAQTREKRDDGSYVVDGATVYDARGDAVTVYDSWVSASADCAFDFPADVVVTRSRYDALHRQIETTSTTGKQTKTEYLPLSVRVFSTDDLTPGAVGENTPSLLVQDGLGRVVAAERQERAGGAVSRWTFGYDDLSQLALVEDAEGNRKVQERDRKGRIVAVDDATFGRVTFAYDDDDNVVREAANDGSVIVRAYDDLGRVIEEFVDGDKDATLVETFYDVHPSCPSIGCENTAAHLAGVRAHTAVGLVEDALSYDVRGRLTKSARSVMGASFTMQNTYDNAGRLRSSLLPDGRRVDVAVDNRGEVKSVAGYVADIAHDEHARVTGYRVANGVEVSFGYDDDDRLTSLRAQKNGAALVDLAYRFDENDNLTAIVDAVGAGALSSSKTLAYDGHGRLTSAVIGAGDAVETLRYAYDDLERITSLTSSLGETSPRHMGSYGYTADAPQAVSSTDRATYVYDGRGRLTARDGDDALAVGFDGFGRLGSITRDRAGADGAATTTTTTWAYAGAGNGKLWKRVGAEETLWISDSYQLVDGMARLQVRVAGDVVVEEDSAALAAAVVGDEDGDGAVSAYDALQKQGDARRLALRCAARVLLAGDDGLDRATLLSDHQGSVVAVADDDGAVVERFAFAPTGLVLGKSAVQSEHARFAGNVVDDSGVIDLGARALLPGEGRFLSPDPTFRLLSGDVFERLPDSVGSYSHAGNSPISTIDLDGRFRWEKKHTALAVVAGAVGVGLVTAGIVTGVIPALALATAGVFVAALSTMAIVGAVIGGVTALAGELAVQRELATTRAIVTPKKKTTTVHWALGALHCTRAFVTGAVAGFFSLGVSAVFSVASASVRIAEQRGKLKGNALYAAKAAVALGGVAAGGDYAGGTEAVVDLAASAGRAAAGQAIDALASGSRAERIAIRVEREAYWNQSTRARGDGVSRPRLKADLAHDVESKARRWEHHRALVRGTGYDDDGGGEFDKRAGLKGYTKYRRGRPTLQTHHRLH